MLCIDLHITGQYITDIPIQIVSELEVLVIQELYIISGKRAQHAEWRGKGLFDAVLTAIIQSDRCWTIITRPPTVHACYFRKAF